MNSSSSSMWSRRPEGDGSGAASRESTAQRHCVALRGPLSTCTHVALRFARKLTAAPSPTPLCRCDAVMPAIVVRQRKSFRRKDGTVIYFEDNAGVIVNTKGEMKGEC